MVAAKLKLQNLEFNWLTSSSIVEWSWKFKTEERLLSALKMEVDHLHGHGAVASHDLCRLPSVRAGLLSNRPHLLITMYM